MQIRWMKSLDELGPYADDWERLAGGVPFRSWTWLSRWWRHYGPLCEAEAARMQLAVLCMFDDSGALMGIAPWYLESSAIRGRVLKHLGSGEVCSDYLTVLCQPGREEAVISALADYLVENAFDDGPDALRWDLLELDGVDSEDPVMAQLAEELGDSGCSVQQQSKLSCWRLELPTDWSCYVASLGKHMRYDVRRLDRLLEQQRAEYHTATRLDEFPDAMKLLIDLHQKRRQSIGERGCFASPRFGNFHRDVATAMICRGQAQLSWLEIDGRPAAAEYQLMGGGVVFGYQTGMEPELSKHKPGHLINLMVLRQAIEQGYRACDFLRGDEPYKARFGAKPRPSLELCIVPRRTVAQWRHGIWEAGRSMKRWMTRGTAGVGQVTKVSAARDEERNAEHGPPPCCATPYVSVHEDF